MLLPIFILQPKFKKVLNCEPDLAIKQSYTWRICNAIQITLTKTNEKIHYLLHQGQENLPKKLSLKYFFGDNRAIGEHQFFLQMTRAKDEALLQQLKSEYSYILINYFTTDKKLKEKIDKFINAVFYANIPVPQIIEIHMELIEDFSKQLRLEGRSDESLLDYRLTLIDILAHLCELYRSSMSK
ncbi:circadian clock protein KaiA [Aetokthonos hydrillicola Thurmond2011]|jgi:circadian clock protein KaiA|uniref:Circadian clock oscillator protein KaiA n=2 Tax=Aetokthonos TaxID=1550243 RepID=A0AAP5IAJ9_9CYAN|nr:KaiA family protein [Aetokthonos hydrillicola]MBO3460698.1 KaiA family protein [Aetokthonos hydrillicola CCALA 1050]MBW4587695.1 circadian clock protein KaiA [Aetokthonos hydrillicola CCALA 1050]MDR9897923.1 circadian clock protein KaiA [Aetokthonos hydrillicola Thurmond2011]